jgi:hypothetical protein
MAEPDNRAKSAEGKVRHGGGRSGKARAAEPMTWNARVSHWFFYP